MSAAPDAGREGRGLRLGLLGVCGFSLTLPMTRIAVADLDPVVVGLGRSLISAVLAAIILLWKRDPFPGRRHLPGLLAVVFGVIVGFPLFSAFALRSVPAAHGAVVVGILPLGTALFGALLAGERPSAGFWIAALAGSAAVVAFIHHERNLSPEKADGFLLAAVGTCALGYAEGGRLSRELGGWRVISWALVLAAPALAVAVLFAVRSHGLHATPKAWLALGYLGFVSMFFAFWAWYQGLAWGGVARVSQIQLLQPFLTIAAAWILLGERIHLSMIVAAAVVMTTVALGRKAAIVRAP